jgi:hypothetical protein
MSGAPEAVFFGVIAVLTAISLWRELPVQYVITVGVITYGIAALWCLLLRQPCWWLPLIVLNSRGVSRLILYRWRDREYYGWWLMALTCALSTVLAPGWSTPLLALAMQLSAMPWLIKRRPTADAPSYFPLVNWLGTAAWLLILHF